MPNTVTYIKQSPVLNIIFFFSCHQNNPYELNLF
jgi:hypothetical protein